MVVAGNPLNISADFSVNVIGRPLLHGDWAVVFVNVGLKDSDIVCDSKCLGDMGFSHSQTIRVRDLWEHRDEPSFSGSYTVRKVPGGGSSKMVKFSK
jgi:hypothetical protein